MGASRRNARRKAPSLSQRLQQWLPTAQKLLQALLGASALALLLFVGLMSFRAMQGLAVERIVVSGKLEHLRQEAVREALTPDLGNGLVFLSLQDLRQKLEALPWVYRAQLRRRFPDTLEVYVQEQLPIARWGDDAFLNHEARVTEVSDAERWQDLPRIQGPEGSEARLMSRYQILLDQLGSLALTPVSLHEDNFGQLRVRLDRGMDVYLGDHDFTLRLQRFMQLWRRELQHSSADIARVDMRYDGGAAVAFEHTPQVAGIATDSQGR